MKITCKSALRQESVGPTSSTGTDEKATAMEKITLEYKQDAYGHPIKAHVFHSNQGPQVALPIGASQASPALRPTLTLFQR